MENYHVSLQVNFSSGLNMLAHPTQLGEGEYARLFNARTRFGGIEPVRQPIQVKSIPQGKIQGIYGIDYYLLLFVDGKAYWRNYLSANPAWNSIDGLQLDKTVDYIYTCAVPASSINWKRSLTTSAQAQSDIIFTTTGTTKTPSAIVCQDGKNQPWLIFPDGSARQAHFYADWDSTVTGVREYVPIGKQMIYIGGKLYIVGKDVNGKFTQIFHSVTGRPLDFVVNIDNAGNKGGDASTTAHQVDYSEVTAVAPISLAGSDGFYVATAKSSYIVLPDFSELLFGEPKFKNQFLFDVGTLNNFSVIDLNGDTALIDANGVRSFNAVTQLKLEGKNAPFSAKLQPLFNGIIQDYVATAPFDNYCLFAVKTIYGYAVLVYDNILQQWVGIDQFPAIGGAAIRKFASIEVGAIKSLFFTTSDNKLWEAYNTSAATETAYVYVGEFIPADPAQEHKPEILNLNFVEVLESGTVNAACYVDSLLEKTLKQPVTQDTISSSAAITKPFLTSTADLTRPVSFNFRQVEFGWRIGYYISWDFMAKLVLARSFSNIRSAFQSRKQQAREYASNT